MNQEKQIKTISFNYVISTSSFSLPLNIDFAVSKIECIANAQVNHGGSGTMHYPMGFLKSNLVPGDYSLCSFNLGVKGINIYSPTRTISGQYSFTVVGGIEEDYINEPTNPEPVEINVQLVFYE